MSAWGKAEVASSSWYASDKNYFEQNPILHFHQDHQGQWWIWPGCLRGCLRGIAVASQHITAKMKCSFLIAASQGHRNCKSTFTVSRILTWCKLSFCRFWILSHILGCFNPTLDYHKMPNSQLNLKSGEELWWHAFLMIVYSLSPRHLVDIK